MKKKKRTHERKYKIFNYSRYCTARFDRAMKPSPATHSRVLLYIAQCQSDTTSSIPTTT